MGGSIGRVTAPPGRVAATSGLAASRSRRTIRVNLARDTLDDSGVPGDEPARAEGLGEGEVEGGEVGGVRLALGRR